ncbi:MAG: DUF1553 domain-containing protein, partial [Planctomycetota bacterium]|nr:DUF1553 domain-containing protein [Planctomycetota bacterium]
WITSPDNPLTARVIANRTWQHHFGRGIARTTSDFGTIGEAPTHPELLDWLATEIVHLNWDRKAILKTLVMSATYRQSTVVTKAKLADDLLTPCRLCWRECEVDRKNGELGDCKLGAEIRCYNEFIHYGEEQEIIPTHAVFLSGCNFRCRFCSEWKHVVKVENDPIIKVEALATRIAERQEQGAQTLSFIGGTPDVNMAGILECLCKLAQSPALVWNSNMTWSTQSAPILRGLVDSFVADWKFGNDLCGKKLAGIDEHQSLVPHRILKVAEKTFTIVRHLVMPGHINCCTRPVLQQIRDKAPGIRLNLMDQYQSVPVTSALKSDPLSKSLSAEEFALAEKHALDYGLCLESREPSRSFEVLEIEEKQDSVGFESKITITADGDLVIENLDASMIELANQLAPNDESLQRFKLPSKGPIKELREEEGRDKPSC